MASVLMALAERNDAPTLSDADRVALHETVDAIATEPSDDNIATLLILLSTVVRTRPKRHRR